LSQLEIGIIGNGITNNMVNKSVPEKTKETFTKKAKEWAANFRQRGRI
tara:strand:- start:2994 stop:3137 length:144 start_codon:yes stop_codon:yes gene_type:complete